MQLLGLFAFFIFAFFSNNLNFVLKTIQHAQQLRHKTVYFPASTNLTKKMVIYPNRYYRSSEKVLVFYTAKR
jgi:hypothetical protein